ncbi:thiolase family protein [Amycolatopsis sp. GM8]|uniref:thiolase family protein n=1 Tax=Amycolatopsis sp. GM8 TaxID=2896530 RepID=UPI001F34FAC8|nr:thiolase family protein [Amycolatopsis sp. GM8]
MNDDIWILGIAMTRFGKHRTLDELDLATAATRSALADGDVSIQDIDMIAGGCYRMAAENIGQLLQKQIGQTGIPVYNVTNACATGATALRTAIMALKAGEARFALAFGVEKLSGAGLLAGHDRESTDEEWVPKGRVGAVTALDGHVGTDTMPGVFAEIGMEYAHRYGGVDAEVFAGIAEKNHAHSTLNPLAAYTKPMSLAEIMNDVMVAYPNTRSMCSANSDGAAAAVLTTGEALRHLSAAQRRRAVKVSASVLTSDPYTDGCQVLPDINTLTRRAADLAYEQAGIGPQDLDLIELHDCFATAELVHYDNLGLCEPGEAGEFFRSGATWRDGASPVNVSGGLISKGHPIAATGIANVWEITHHLRGEAGERQIAGARAGLAHVLGLGSACGIHILEKAAA